MKPSPLYQWLQDEAARKLRLMERMLEDMKKSEIVEKLRAVTAPVPALGPAASAKHCAIATDVRRLADKLESGELRLVEGKPEKKKEEAPSSLRLRYHKALAALFGTTNPRIISPYMHAEQIADRAYLAIRDKYKQGQAEHGGHLALKRVTAMIREEAVDQLVYIDVLETQLCAALRILEDKGLSPWDKVPRVRNLLLTGNVAGLTEAEINEAHEEEVAASGAA